MNTIVSVATVLAVMFLALSPALAHEAGETYGMGPWMMNWGYGMGWYGSVIMVVVWIAVIVAVVVFARWLIATRHGDGQGNTNKPESAREILDKRYARGDIDKEQYERMKKDLS